MRHLRESARDRDLQVVATLTSASELEEAAPELLAEVSVLEVRADLVDEFSVEWVRDRFAGSLLYTLRSRAEGGRFEGLTKDRSARLAKAAPHYELVDLEAAQDLEPEILEAVSRDQRILSWHGGPTEVDELRRRLEGMEAVGGRWLKLVPNAVRAGQELAALELLAEVDREDVVAFATGECGLWSRVFAPCLGSPLVFGSLGTSPAAPGQPSVERLLRDYGFPRRPRPERVFGIVGQPVAHSLSPRIHNGAYSQLGVAALYLPFHVDRFEEFWSEVAASGCFERWGTPLAGLSVSAPWKEAALAVATASSADAQAIGGANTLICQRGFWRADSTDADGVLGPLEALGCSFSAVAAVVGCGGAGRAAAVGLDRAGASVTVVNRGVQRGRLVAERLALPFLGLDDFDPSCFDIVVHATSLGHRSDDPLPFDPSTMRREAFLVDLVYDEHETELVQAARAAELRVVTGREVLLHQAFSQFHAMTGEDLPPIETAARLEVGAIGLAEGDLR